MNIKRAITSIALVCTLGLTAVACQDTSRNATTNKERSVATQQLDSYLVSQPVPVFDGISQLRQNLIEIETAQVRTTATTAFFFNQAVADPIQVCPAIGFPIPASYQLTNPLQKLRGDTDAVVAQLEATGVYTGDTTGTYVICVGDDGQAYADYWEGFVKTVTGVADWDYTNHRIVMKSGSSFDFSEGKK